jgi:hypothetical protein
MRLFFATLPRHIIECFKGRMLLWHLTAILITLVLVVSGFDWDYFLWTRSPMLRPWLFTAVPIGGLVPVAVPLVLFLVSGITRNVLLRQACGGPKFSTGGRDRARFLIRKSRWHSASRLPT